MIRTDPLHARIHLADETATTQLGAALSEHLRPGDTILLSGDIGAGKSHLARATIRALMDRWGAPAEEIPSPTFTLVQSYDTPRGEIWHADLYRLTLSTEVEELGLSAAFGQELCLVEWPDRLGPEAPEDALSVFLAPDGPEGASRTATLTANRQRWQPVLDLLAEPAPQTDPA